LIIQFLKILKLSFVNFNFFNPRIWSIRIFSWSFAKSESKREYKGKNDYRTIHSYCL